MSATSVTNVDENAGQQATGEDGASLIQPTTRIELFHEVNLGATAIGTGINADPRYAAVSVAELTRIAKLPLTPATNLIEATSDMGAFALFSGVVKRIAVKLSKIANEAMTARVRRQPAPRQA